MSAITTVAATSRGLDVLPERGGEQDPYRHQSGIRQPSSFTVDGNDGSWGKVLNRTDGGNVPFVTRIELKGIASLIFMSDDFMPGQY